MHVCVWLCADNNILAQVLREATCTTLHSLVPRPENENTHTRSPRTRLHTQSSLLRQGGLRTWLHTQSSLLRQGDLRTWLHTQSSLLRQGDLRTWLHTQSSLLRQGDLRTWLHTQETRGRGYTWERRPENVATHSGLYTPDVISQRCTIKSGHRGLGMRLTVRT